MQGYEIGISALRAHQQRLLTAGQNIANASTPGYHRQRVELAARRAYGNDAVRSGSGVDVTLIRRLRDSTLEQALWRSESGLAAATARADATSRLETLLTPGPSSLHAQLRQFFDRLEQVANLPSDPVARQAFLAAAQGLGEEFSAIDRQLQQLSDSLVSRIEEGVEQVNTLTAQLAELNRQIGEARRLGAGTHELEDQRDQLVTELARWVDVAVDDGPDGSWKLQLGDVGYFGSPFPPLERTTGADGHQSITRPPGQESVAVSSGQLRGWLDAVNEAIPSVRERLATLADDLLREVNTLHATGLPAGAGFVRLTGEHTLSDPDVPLALGGLADELSAGPLFVTITDEATGARQTHRVDVDPAVDSLRVVSQRLDALTGLAAFVNPRGALVLAGEPGYRFDFAGRVDTAPQSATWTGTAALRLLGTFTGTADDDWSFTVVGSGTVGVSPGLAVEVRNGTGQLLTTVDVGQGYVAGSAITVADGVSLSLPHGTINAGDTAVITLVAEPDPAGLLAALGINPLFTGSLAGGLSVRADLRDDPALLALSRTGEVGDAANAERLLRLRTSLSAAGGTQTVTEELASVTASAGLLAEQALFEEEFLTTQTDQIRAHQQSVSGVNPDEELLQILESQRAYQAAARFLTTLSETLDELLRLVS
jgi:flagellar hook-associated protein FlgK